MNEMDEMFVQSTSKVSSVRLPNVFCGLSPDGYVNQVQTTRSTLSTVNSQSNSFSVMEKLGVVEIKAKPVTVVCAVLKILSTVLIDTGPF